MALRCHKEHTSGPETLVTWGWEGQGLRSYYVICYQWLTSDLMLSAKGFRAAVGTAGLKNTGTDCAVIRGCRECGSA